MELYVFSEYQPKSREDTANLKKIAAEAVFSLANEFGGYGDRFQKCWLSDDEYYEKTFQANHMILLMGETVHSEDMNLKQDALIDHWPLKDIPPLIGHLATNPAIRGHKLPMHPAMEKVIRAYARQSCWRRFWRRRADTTDPIQMAALELLGQAQDWDVSKFKLIKFFQLNPVNALNQSKSFYSHRLFEEFRRMSVSERLAFAADYYLFTDTSAR